VRREYPERPVAGVAAVILNENAVLLVKRKNPPGEGNWGLPGGVVELGEPIGEAIVREVREECGLEVKLVKRLAIFDFITRDEAGKVKFHYILFEFLCRIIGGTLASATDALDARWMPLERLEDLPISQGTIRFIRRVAAKSKTS
jgi:ADP-ribose pyrophosphatase YjhB (NUDIX family)